MFDPIRRGTVLLLLVAILAGALVARGEEQGASLQQSERVNITSQIRRVVTGKDSSGKAIVVIDDVASNVRKRRNSGITSTLLWVTDSTPASISGNADAADREISIEPPPNGTIFRVVEYAPEKDIAVDDETRLRTMKERGLGPEGMSSEHPRHPGMHRTSTVDYAVILSGEINMLLDDSEVHLKAGDVVVQRGTNHAWVNRGEEPCKIAFILISAEE